MDPGGYVIAVSDVLKVPHAEPHVDSLLLASLDAIPDAVAIASRFGHANRVGIAVRKPVSDGDPHEHPVSFCHWFFLASCVDNADRFFDPDCYAVSDAITIADPHRYVDSERIADAVSKFDSSVDSDASANRQSNGKRLSVRHCVSNYQPLAGYFWHWHAYEVPNCHQISAVDSDRKWYIHAGCDKFSNRQFVADGIVFPSRHCFPVSNVIADRNTFIDALSGETR
jgi:hypothetical protein